MDSSKQPLASLADIVRGELARLGGGRFDAMIAVQKQWVTIVGELMASRTRILSVKDGCLMIETDGAVWSNELALQKTLILARLRETAPLANVSQLRIRVGT